MKEVTESTKKRKRNQTETAFFKNTDQNRTEFVHMETVTTLDVDSWQ